MTLTEAIVIILLGFIAPLLVMERRRLFKKGLKVDNGHSIRYFWTVRGAIEYAAWWKKATKGYGHYEIFVYNTLWDEWVSMTDSKDNLTHWLY